MAIMNINTDNYPHLTQLIKENPVKAKEVMGVFISLIDESVKEKWHELPQMFSGGELSFESMIKGILHGSLDLPEMNPEAYDALKEEVHPLSMLAPRKDYGKGITRVYDWRSHYRLPRNAPVNQDTIAEIFRKLLRYYKYVKIDDLAKATILNQVATFQSMDEALRLPYYPAIRYQQEHMGDLAVGTFFSDVGAFDLGTLKEKPEICLACNEPSELWEIGNKIVCPRCNGGWELKA